MVLDRYKHVYIAIAMKEIRYVFSKNGATKLRSTAYVDWKMSSTYPKPKMTVRFSVHRHNRTIVALKTRACSSCLLPRANLLSHRRYIIARASLAARAYKLVLSHGSCICGSRNGHMRILPARSCSRAKRAVFHPARAGWPRASEREPKANWR